MTDLSTPETNFTFVLTDGENKAIAGAEYMIYDSEGKLVDNDSRYTDNFGQFTLKAGQAAIFTGILPDTVYNVSEKNLPGYVQVTPASAEGYTNQKVSATPVVLPFANEEQELTGSLSVSKNVVSEMGAIESDKEFTFVLLDRNDAPVANALYKIGEKTYRTDSDGKFVLKANETALFERLVLDRDYSVRELGVLLEDGTYSLEEYKPIGGDTQTGELTEDGLAFIFDNYYKSFTDLTILKVDKRYPDTVLSGAIFRLEKLDENNNIDESFTPQEITTGEDGIAVFTDLISGKYVITEVKAPERYNKLSAPPL